MDNVRMNVCDLNSPHVDVHIDKDRVTLRSTFVTPSVHHSPLAVSDDDTNAGAAPPTDMGEEGNSYIKSNNGKHTEVH